MTLNRKPSAAKTGADAYVGGAPDSSVDVYEKGIAKGNKRQISLTIAPALLRQVDELAQKTGQTRAGLINLAIYRAIEGQVFVGD